MAGPDLRVLIGVLGGANISGDTGSLIISELKTIASQINGNHMPRVKVAVDINKTRDLFQQQLQQIANGVNVTATIKSKIVADGNKAVSVFDTAALEAEGRKYFRATSSVIDDVKREYASLGQVDIKNVFKSADGDIKSFTVSVSKADTTIESFKYKLAQLNDGVSNFKGFAQMGSIGADKTAGSGLESTLTFLSRIEAKMANISSKTFTDTAKPLLQGTAEFDAYATKLQGVTARIEEIKASTTALSGGHKREINSMVSDLQRYAKELQSSAYAGTDLKAKSFTAQKAQLQANLTNEIKQWTNAGIFGGDFEQAAIKAKTLLASATDSTGLDAYLHKYRLLQAEFKGTKLGKAAWGGIADSVNLDTNIETARLRVQNLKTTYSSFVSDPQLKKQWQALFDQSQIVNSQKGLTGLNAQVDQFEQKLIAAGKNGTSAFATMAQNFQKMAVWMLMGTAVATVIGGIKGIYTAVVDVNKQMVELKKVTNETDVAYARFFDSAASRATKLGTSLTDLIQSTATFARLGFSMDEAKGLAEIANIYSVVGDEVKDIDSASKSIISVMKAFNIGSSEAMSIVDKFNEVGNNYAISSGGIGESLLRSASALAAANNTLDESIALIVAANNVAQDPEAVGTAWKTVGMRIRGAKVELEEAGLDTELMAESTAKLRDNVMALTNVNGLGGIDILADDESFKSTYQTMLEISKVWDQMSDIDQAALLELLAGKRQGNIVAAAIENMDEAVEAFNTSLNSSGSAMEEHSKWLDGIEAKQKQFAAQYQDFANTFLNSELVKGTLDAGTGILGWLTSLVDTLGALPPLIAVLYGIRSAASGKGIVKIDRNKDWLGSGIGLTTSFASNKATTAEFEKQLAIDHQSLLKWEAAVKKGSISTRSFEKAMNGASVQAKAYAVETQGVTKSADAYKAKQIAAAAATKSTGIAAKAAGVGVQILNVAMNMLISMGVALAIQAIIAGLDAMVNAAANASVKADEFAQKQREVADAASEESKNLDELISKYEKLRNTDAVDATTRSEICNIQEQITDLIGDQAGNLDLVNGKLDEELKKLKELELQSAKDAQDSYVASYHADRTAADKAVGDDSYLFVNGYSYVGKKDNAAHDALQGVKNSWGMPIAQKGGFLESDLFISAAGTAEEQLEQLRAAMDALKESANYDYANSDTYAGLNSAASHLATYIKKVNESSNGLVSSTAIVASMQQELSGATVDSAESYQKYRQNIIDTAMADEALSAAMADGKITVDSVTKSVDNLMATDFPKWYNEVNNMGQDSGATQKPSFTSMSEALKAAQTARDAYKSVSDDIESAPEGKISLSALNSLVGTYSGLETAVSDYLSGAIDEQAMLDILAQKYTEAANAAGYNITLMDELSDSSSELSTRLSKLSDVQTQFNSLSAALGEFSDSGIVGATTFTQLQTKFGNLESFNNFVAVLGNSNSTMAESREATNRLAAEFISTNGVLDDLTESTAALTIAELESYGVTNAEEIVTGRLSAARLEATLAANGLTNATWSVAVTLLQEQGASEAAIASLKALRQEQYNAKLACTDFTTASADVITSLMSQATAAGVAAESISALSQMLALKVRHDSGAEIKDYEEQMAALAGKAKADLSGIKVILPEVKISLPKSSGSKNDVEEYIVKIDALREATKKLNDVQKELETTEARLGMVESTDYAKRIEYAKTLASLKEKENQLLHEQTDLRRGLILENVDKLRGYGFDVQYDAKENDFFVKNIELVNKLGTGGKKEINDFRKSIEDLISTTEGMNDANVDSSLAWLKNAEEAKKYKKEIMAIRQEQADEWVDISEHNISLWDNHGNKEDKIIGQYQQMMDYVAKLANEYRAAGYSEESKEIRELGLLWWDYSAKISDVQKKLDDERLKGLNEQKEAQQEILDLTIEMIKQETEDQIDALVKSRDLYKEIIDLKIKSLELTEKERSYQDNVDSQTKDIGKLQSQADALALDDSREAQLKRAELLDQIAEKQKDLSDTQHDYAIDNEKDALNEEYDMYSNVIDDKIDSLKEFLNDNERLTQEAYRRINTQGQSHYDDLLRYAKKYTKTSGDELSTMWDNAMLAAKKYSDYLAGMKATQDAIDHLEGNNSNLVDDMKDNSSSWKPGRDDLAEENDKAGASIGATKDPFGYWWKDGELLYGANYYSEDKIKALMKQYSDAWKSTSDKATQDTYANRALYLGNGIGATRDNNGRWYKNGKPLYHTGGVIGDQPTAKQKEILMYGETGEMVLTEPMQANLFKTIALNDFIKKQLGGTINAGVDMLGMFKHMTTGITTLNELTKSNILAPSAAGIRDINMDVSFIAQGDISKATVEFATKKMNELLGEFTTNITKRS